MKLIEDKGTRERYIRKKCIMSYNLYLYVIIFLSSWDTFEQTVGGRQARTLEIYRSCDGNLWGLSKNTNHLT